MRRRDSSAVGDPAQPAEQAGGSSSELQLVYFGEAFEVGPAAVGDCVGASPDVADAATGS